MIRSRSMTLFAGAAVLPLTALAAGCGSGGSSGATAAAPPAPSPVKAAARPAVVRSAKTHLGTVLVNSKGRTLYLFKKDSSNKSACSGMCATFWPPLRTSGKPQAGSGLRGSLLGTIKRSDGRSQVTYKGHPLYTFVMDTKAGQTNGQGKVAFGGSWFVVSPSGAALMTAPQPVAPKATPKPVAPKATPKPVAPKPTPKPTPKPPATGNGIPQNGGGDGDSDNNGGPSDGDGGV